MTVAAQQKRKQDVRGERSWQPWQDCSSRLADGVDLAQPASEVAIEV